MSKDSKYFTTTKKGEIHELRRDLDSPKENVKKEAVKKVIAAMTVGKDVSVLFPDVVKCIRTTNPELKKLVYLYIMNYAKTQPDLAILSVNAFVHDAQHPNPLIRALAVRTMGCIRVDKITEYLCQPLRECLKDSDPYVRKTAAVCVAKVWDINSELVETQGFLDTLRELLSDANPMVVANAVAALTEIDETSSRDVFKINTSNLNKLLTALDDCTEWGQVFILHALSKYTPTKPQEAEGYADRIAPRLAHANSAVVLSTIRVLMRLLDFTDNQTFVKNMCAKMTPPLVTLIQKEPEIQYVALRNINLIIQKRPKILQGEMKVFFCKYNDPIYVKMEKLEIMILLVSDRNIDQVLLELKEYATEVDIEFVRKAVRALGRCAIKLESAAERCIQVLLELIQTKVNYVVQETIIVIKDIFRKYPRKYEVIIATLCQNLDTLDEPEAKAALIWIIGEYAERIENADELLETFLVNFQEEPSMVQLQILTAAVKLFLKRPKNTQKLVQTALDLATKEAGNPDLRDRGFVYWRLLSASPEAAKQVVLSEKPLISDDSNKLEPALLDDLIKHMSTLASVYHKPPESFVVKYTKKVPTLDSLNAQRGNRGDDDESEFADDSNVGAVPQLLQFGDEAPAASRPAVAAYPVLLNATDGKGLEIRGGFERQNAQIVFSMNLVNHTNAPMQQFMIQLNKNLYRLKPVSPQIPIQGLNPGQVANVAVVLNNQGEPESSTVVQIAIKKDNDVFYFSSDCPVYVFWTEDGRMDKNEYLQNWKQIPDATEHTVKVGGLQRVDVEDLIGYLGGYNLFLIAKRSVDGNDVMYLSCKVTPPGAWVLVEITLYAQERSAKCCIRTLNQPLLPFVEYALRKLLS